MNLPNLPPDRALVNPQDGRSTDSWYLYFDTLTRWIKANGGTVYSTSAQRTTATAKGYVSPGSVADGTVYVETDTGLLYQMRSGAWVALNFVLGASNLTHANRITKVTSSGTITEASLSDDGTNVSGTEPLHLDTGATPANSQVTLKANALGVLSLLCYAADNIDLGMDVEFSGAAWIARHAGICMIQKNGGKLNIYGSTGNVVGSAPTLTLRATIDLATGDVNAVTGSYQVAGTKVVGARGAALTASGAAVGGSAGTVYPGTAQAAINDTILLANNLKTRLDQLEARMQAHGLIT